MFMTKKTTLLFLTSILSVSFISAQNNIKPWNKKTPNFRYKQTYIQQIQSNTLFIGEEQNNNDYLKIDLRNQLIIDETNKIKRVIFPISLDNEHNGVKPTYTSTFKELTLNIDKNQKIIEYYGDTALSNYFNQIQFFDFTGLSPILDLKSKRNIGDQWVDSNFMPKLGIATFKLVNITDNRAKIEVNVDVNMIQEVQSGELIQFNFIGNMNGSIIINTDFANFISQRDFNFNLEGRIIYSETKLEIPSTIKGSFSNNLEIL
ncbi:MAG: hypothetical protein RL263_45 [Bacteroidota bacterium]